MWTCRLPIHVLSVIYLCGIAVGCVTEPTKTDGSFTTGGPGKYGQQAPGTASPPLASAPGGAKTNNYSPSPKLQLALANFQEIRGYRDEARKSYEQVLAVDSKSIDAVIGLARLDQIAGRKAEAEAGFLKAVQLDSQSGRALDALGQFYVEQKRLEEGLATLQRALAAAPEDKTCRFHYAIAMAKSGQIEQAIPQLVESVGLAAAHYNIGLILHERGDLTGSEEQFVAAILENPRLQPAQYWLTEVRRERDQLQHAGATRTQEQPAVTDRGSPR